jgi:hypothetical protein
VLIAEDSAETIASLGKKPLVGRVEAVQSENMTVSTSRGPVVIPLKGIARLEVSHRGRNLKRGALIGGLVGLVALTTLSVAAFGADDDYSISTGESFLIGALLGVPAGGVIGLGVGAVAPAWHDVPIPKAAVSRRAALTLTIRF